MFNICIKGAKSYLCLPHNIPRCVKENLTVDRLFVSLMMSHCCFIIPPPIRMDTTEQCNAVISHFNGKFIKIASGALGRKKIPLSVHFPSNKNCSAGND